MTMTANDVEFLLCCIFIVAGLIHALRDPRPRRYCGSCGARWNVVSACLGGCWNCGEMQNSPVHGLEASDALGMQTIKRRHRTPQRVRHSAVPALWEACDAERMGAEVSRCGVPQADSDGQRQDVSACLQHES